MKLEHLKLHLRKRTALFGGAVRATALSSAEFLAAESMGAMAETDLREAAPQPRL